MPATRPTRQLPPENLSLEKAFLQDPYQDRSGGPWTSGARLEIFGELFPDAA